MKKQRKLFEKKNMQVFPIQETFLFRKHCNVKKTYVWIKNH